MTPSPRLGFVLALAMCATAVAAQPVYTVTELGVLPGYGSSLATSLNDRGEVVGYCSPASENFNQAAFVWRAGGLTPIGILPGGHYSTAATIGPTGLVAGTGDTGNFRPQGWVTTPAGLVNFFPNNGGNTYAVSVDANGVIGGYYTKSLSGWVSSWKGAVWTPDPRDPRKYRLTNLPILPGGIDPKSSYALPYHFNLAGQAAGTAQTDQIGQHAAFWDNDAAHSIVDLGSLPGDGSSHADGLNDLGQAVGSSHPPFGSRPVLWQNDAGHTAVELPLLPGDNFGSATAINNRGEILGTSAYATPGTWEVGPSRLVIWRDSQVFELQTLLDPLTGAGWTLVAVTALNNQGQIVGLATKAGASRAVLLSELP